MSEILLALLLAVVLAMAVLQIALLRRRMQPDFTPLEKSFATLEKVCERSERAVREEIGKNREETSGSARQSREELSARLKDVADSLHQQLAALTLSNEQKLESVRATVEGRLKAIQEDNAKSLEQMRATVDEKLQGTLEKRLGESFKIVSDRLEQVHKGLGEMQTLATGVGDLKRVLTNVKARGMWGEVQLAALLDEVLTPDQYGSNVAVSDSGARVEFAIKFPGRGQEDAVVWLPIDAKFPMEDYQRLVAAQEAADAEAAELACRQLELRIKACAGDICGKYVCPPRTTDFAIMFLPTEGLFAEVMRRIGLSEYVQRECKVTIAGPSTLWAILNSFQMGFRTLQIQKRSSEVWDLLGEVKTQFALYADVMGKVKKKLEQATSTVDSVAARTRAIQQRLRGVESLAVESPEPLMLAEETLEEEEA